MTDLLLTDVLVISEGAAGQTPRGRLQRSGGNETDISVADRQADIGLVEVFPYEKE